MNIKDYQEKTAHGLPVIGLSRSDIEFAREQVKKEIALRSGYEHSAWKGCMTGLKGLYNSRKFIKG